jgi:hypothetical protein
MPSRQNRHRSSDDHTAANRTGDDRADPKASPATTGPRADGFTPDVGHEQDEFFLSHVAPEADEDSRDAELTELEELAAAEQADPTTDTPTERRADRRSGPSPEARTADSAPWNQGGVVDRRMGLDRRAMADAQRAKDGHAKEGKKTDLDRRRGPGRRLSDFTRSAEEGEMTPEQFLFLKAIDGFKEANKKFYPSWTDVLEVIRLVGYRKTMPCELELSDVEDWREAANAPSAVRPIRPEDREQGEKKTARKNAGKRKAA